MGNATPRRNAWLLPWLRAAAFAAIGGLALHAVPFYPAPAVAAAVVACGVLGLLAPALAVLLLVVTLALPMAAGDLVLGALFLIIGLATLQYLGADDSRAFLVVSLTFAALALNAGWTLAVLAGFLFGPADGALAAFVACVAVEVAGVLFGHPVTGVLATGGTRAVVDLHALSSLPHPLAFGWFSKSLAGVDPGALASAFVRAGNVTLLLVQPALWAGAAALAGTLRRRPGAPGRAAVGLAGTGGALVVLVAASIGAMAALGGPVPLSTMVAGGLGSLAVALVCVALSDWVFTPQAPAVATAAGSIRAEDADVDELLRLIASAEDQLESRHAVDKAVLITDMKAFTRLTQEQGSIRTAKMIQRHRDLLLPVIAGAGGHGKSSGGDGLVAAFDSADDALAAAVRMQRTLEEHNRSRKPEQRVQIRAGVATGEIIVDRSGAPFIGDALNIAARVMSLADGGQVFATHEVVDQSADLPAPVVSHGEFDLKHIAHAVTVYEVLWAEGQQPRRPEAVALAGA